MLRASRFPNIIAAAFPWCMGILTPEQFWILKYATTNAGNPLTSPTLNNLPTKILRCWRLRNRADGCAAALTFVENSRACNGLQRHQFVHTASVMRSYLTHRSARCARDTDWPLYRYVEPMKAWMCRDYGVNICVTDRGWGTRGSRRRCLRCSADGPSPKVTERHRLSLTQAVHFALLLSRIMSNTSRDKMRV